MPWRASDARRPSIWLALALTAVALRPAPAVAETQTGTLTVSAEVLSGCNLIGGTLDFGSYVSGQASDLDAAGRIEFVNCSGTLKFELDGGANGSVNDRKMRGPEDRTLDYQIYTSATRQTVWGGGNAFELPLQTDGTPSSGFVPVHGRIRGGQAVPGGSYSDTVNITLTFE
jgi:spore coat protein U-like protein